MTESQKIELRRSRVRERLAEIANLNGDGYSDDVKAEERSLQDEFVQLERRYRTAIIAEDRELETRRAEAGDLDAEQRERIELRSKARLTEYLLCRAQGRLPSGAEAELQAVAGVSQIPVELWDAPVPEQRSAEERAITPAPGTVGVNLDPIRPAVFANSIAARLGMDMPRVGSGTYATADDHHVAVRGGQSEVRCHRRDCGRTHRNDGDAEARLGASGIDPRRHRGRWSSEL